MTQLSKIDLNADIANNIYTNKQRLIKGNTIKQRLLNLMDSTLNNADDLNMPFGYLGIDAAGRVDVEFITAPFPVGKFLRDDGSWQEVSPLPSQEGNAGKALFTNGVTATWTMLTSTIVNTALGYTPLAQDATAGCLLIGNSSNIATPVAFTLNNTKGPFSVSPTGVLTMPDASSTSRGLLSSADWTMFNNKQAGLGYTPLNKAGDTMSGALTLNADAINPLEPVTYQQLQAWKTGLWNDRGSYSAAGNAFPSSGGSGTGGAIVKGDIWTISTAGILGLMAVNPGDTVRALTDSPGQVITNWTVAEGNLGYSPVSSSLPSGQIFVGGPTNVAGAATLTLSATAGVFSLSNAGVLTMPNANSVTRGLLAAADWVTFNSKQAALGFTPVSNALPAGKIFVGNGSNVATGVGLGLSSTGGTFSLAADGTLTMPNAATGTRGLLTSTDWNTFNNKVAKIGSISSAQLALWYDANTVTASSDITYSNNVFAVSGQIISVNNMYCQAAAPMPAGGAIDVDCRNSSSFSFTLHSHTAFTLQNMANGMTIVIDVTQNALLPYNVTFAGAVETLKWKDSTAPAMTAAANRTDVFTFIKSNGIIYGFFTQNF